MMLICGVNPVLEALAAGTRHFDRLLVVKGLRGKRLAEAIRRATRMGIAIRFEMRETLDRMAGGVPHQGIIAIVSEKPVLTLEALLETARQPALLVVLDGVEDPRNLGAILRTVEAAGADGVLLPERHSAGLSETVARASAGAIEHVRVARVGNLVQALEELKSRGIWVVGFDASGTERWDAVDLDRPVALVLGGEGRGIRRLVREHCDHLVSIPHFGQVSSLNVSVAAGIALYEVVRQRRSVPSLVRPIPRAATAPHVVGPAPGDEGDDEGSFGPPPVLVEDQPDEESGEEPATIAHLDYHEDVAWGRGPTVLKSVESHGRSHRLGRHGKPGHRGTSHPPEASRSDAEPAQAPGATAPRPDGAGAGESAAAQRRRGRRHRRGHREGPAGPAGPVGPANLGNAGGAAPSPPSGGERPAGPEGSGPGGGGASKAGRRRRRRHRPR